MTNYYQILGVTPNATAEQIKSAYREYAKHFHPDKQTNSEFFKRRFQEVQNAYEILSDDAKRKAYDRKFADNSSKYTEQATINELNDKIAKFKADIENKNNSIKRASLDLEKANSERMDLLIKSAALNKQIDLLTFELNKNKRREENAESRGQFILRVKHFFRPPLIYFILLAIFVIGGVSAFSAFAPRRCYGLVSEISGYGSYSPRLSQ